ncbi:MAG: 4Fe-4S dicluster domain-containing protein [Anaerolineales bacterium]|nr:4Fe-4S dicluster domain-containing protein [Anaerolineales bacterium]
MLSPLEKILFLLASLTSTLLAARAVLRLIRIIGRGKGRPEWHIVPGRLVRTIVKTVTFSTVFKARPLTSLFHGLVAWGFIYYLLVNVGDVLQGYISGFVFLGENLLGNLYRLGADLLSISVLVGMIALMVRRYLVRPKAFDIRATTLLHSSAREKIGRDSAIVGVFILLHVGARFIGESFHLASSGYDPWQPFASTLAGLWVDVSPALLEVLRHSSWWLALGLILAFIPYFPQSKHIHLFFTPINFLLQPYRRSMGALDALDFEDEGLEQFGAERLEHLSWKALTDAYACIMCNRCQDACPAYETGKVLSPAAMEINKRLILNQEGAILAAGEPSSRTLIDSAISSEAVWGCTACGACIESCPVGNEPMLDILEIRRHLVLMENAFPEPLQVAYRGMERMANPWNVPPEKRLDWAQGLHVPTVSENPDAELLWWVGCAPATDPRAQKTARALAQVLNAAGVSFAVLGPNERCTGDSARRSGNEYIFSELATDNVEALNRISPRRILTSCPHCLHTLKNEYPDFGGHYQVIHHSELVQEFLDQRRISLRDGQSTSNVTFHDPCYLGRMNDVYEAPRRALRSSGFVPIEMARTRSNSFCCGAGGAQIWKEEEAGDRRVSVERVREAQASGADSLAVGCPFCMIMLTDAARAEGDQIQVKDVVEIVAERLESSLR